APLCTAETDPCHVGFLAPAAKNDGIAVLQEGAGFVTANLNRPAAARTELQQRSRLSGRRPRLSAGSEQIARAQIAAVDGVVRDELPDRPIRMPKRGRREAVRRLTPFTHGRTLNQRVEPDIDCP